MDAAMMSQLQALIQQNEGVRPQFEVHLIEDKVTRTVYGYETKKDKVTGKVTTTRIQNEVQEPGGYMVYFPRGHSIRVRNVETLKRFGFDTQPGLVHMDSGEELRQTPRLSLRDMVERGTKLTPPERLEAPDEIEA